MVLSNYRDYIHIQPKCEFCGKDAEEVHHLTPRTCGGTNDEENLMSLCKHCHNLIHKKITPIGELISFGREHHDIERGELSRLKKAKRKADLEKERAEKTAERKANKKIKRVKESADKKIRKAERDIDLKLRRAERKAEEYSKYYTRYLDYKQNQNFWISEVIKLQDKLEEEKAHNEEKQKRIEKYRNNTLGLLHRVRILEEQLKVQGA